MRNLGLYDIYIDKFDQNGNFIFARVLGTYTSDEAYSISFDNSNNIYICGFAYAPLDIDPGPGTYTVGTPYGGGYAAKYDQSGIFQWVDDLSVPTTTAIIGTCFPSDVICDNLGNALVTGIFSGTIDFDPSASSCNITRTYINMTGFLQKLGTCTLPGIPSNSTPAVNLVGCTSNSVTLTANGTGTINWYQYLSNSIIATGSTCITPPLSPGIDTFYVASSNSCGQSTPLIPITVTVTSSPSVNISGNTAICQGGSSTITASGANSYTWSNSSTSTSIINSPTISTSYSVSGTNTLGCVGFASTTVFVNALPTITVNSGTICSGDSFTINPSGASTYTYSSGSPIVSPSVTTSYSIAGSSSLACVSQTLAIITLTVNPIPTITVNSGSICSGNSFTIAPNGASTYSYSGGVNIVSPITSTNYSITGSTMFGCSNLIPVVSTVIVSPSPTVVAITSNSILCLGQTVTLSVSGANTYTWNNGATSNSIADNPTITTTYTVIGVDLNGCSDSTTIAQSVSLCAGVSQLNRSANEFIKISPNPSSGLFIIECSKDKFNSDLEVYNALGQVLFSKKINSLNTSVDISNYSNGLYYFKVIKDNTPHVFKVIKD